MTLRALRRSTRTRVLSGAVGGLLAAGGVGLGASATAATPPEPTRFRAAAAASTVSPSGVAAPTASTKHWQRVISEEFTRPAPLGRFAAQYPGWAGYDGNRDTSRDTGRPLAQQGLWSSRTTMSVQDGVLDCRLHTKGVTPQVCALTPTATGEWWKGRKYGKYVVRFRADRTPGYKIAWLLWPESNIWDEGEIDFPEGDLAGTITGAAHRLGDPEWTPRYFDTRTTMTGWHTATIAWKPGRITFKLDDRTWTTTRRSVLPKVRMRWALQAETRITRRPPARTTSGHIEIDWVAAYRWRG